MDDTGGTAPGGSEGLPPGAVPPPVTRPSTVPPVADDSAEALLLRVGRGDQTAFAALYDVVAPRAYGLVLRVLRNPALAEEVTQEVLVEAWRTAARFDPVRGSAIGWVMTIAHRRAVDRVRSERAANDRMRRVASASVDTPFDDVIEQTTARLDGEQVRRCLSGLTRLQREAIMLAYYDGHSYPEVARLLGAALPTVKSRMRDGLIRLRDCLGIDFLQPREATGR